MSSIAKLLRLLVATAVLMTATLVPGMASACAAMEPVAMAGMDHGAAATTSRVPEPHAAPRCDFACAACLVQPSPVRAVVKTSWSFATGYAPAFARLDDIVTKPDVPPPRTPA